MAVAKNIDRGAMVGTLRSLLSSNPMIVGSERLQEVVRGALYALETYGARLDGGVPPTGPRWTLAQWTARRDAARAQWDATIGGLMSIADKACRAIEGTRPGNMYLLPYSYSSDPDAWPLSLTAPWLPSRLLAQAPNTPLLTQSNALDEFPRTAASLTFNASGVPALTIAAKDTGAYGNTIEGRIVGSVLELRRDTTVERFNLVAGSPPSWIIPAGATWPPTTGWTGTNDPPLFLGAATWHGMTLPDAIDWQPFTGGHGARWRDLVQRVWWCVGPVKNTHDSPEAIAAALLGADVLAVDVGGGVVEFLPVHLPNAAERSQLAPTNLARHWDAGQNVKKSLDESTDLVAGLTP